MLAKPRRPLRLRWLADRGIIDLDELYAWVKAPLSARAAATRDRLWARYQRALQGVEIAEAELELQDMRRAGGRLNCDKKYGSACGGWSGAKIIFGAARTTWLAAF